MTANTCSACGNLTDVAMQPGKYCGDCCCHDCGGAKKWRFAHLLGGYPHYCKRCTQKNGHPTNISVDVDRLAEIAGPLVAELIIAEGTPTTGWC